MPGWMHSGSRLFLEFHPALSVLAADLIDMHASLVYQPVYKPWLVNVVRLRMQESRTTELLTP